MSKVVIISDGRVRNRVTLNDNIRGRRVINLDTLERDECPVCGGWTHGNACVRCNVDFDRDNAETIAEAGQ